jgi:hypothetical protein
MRARPWWRLVLCLALAGCDGDRGGAAAGPAPLRHDFGVVRHGLVAVARLEVTLPGGLTGLYPRGALVGCPCATYVLEIEDAAGKVRDANFVDPGEKVLRAGERLFLVLKLDTNLKEPADLPVGTTRGYVLVQHPDEPIERQRRVPLEFRFGIDAPVHVRPFAHVDMGRVPRHGSFRATLELAGDERHAAVRLGPATSSDPRLTVAPRPAGSGLRLDLEFRPKGDEFVGALPPMAIRVATDLSDQGGNAYAVEIPVTGRILPEFELMPPGGIHFERIDVTKEHSGFANVHDHELDQPAGLEVFAIKDDNGNSAAAHFEVRLEPVGDRVTRVHVRYRGTLRASFRGTVELARAGKAAPVVRVPYRALKQDP